jgi:hypothetical protein
MSLSSEERARWLEVYRAGADAFQAALAEFPREMWTFKPNLSEWSIHEQIVHVADSEANSYIRARRFVAEPASTVMGYDQDRWAVALDYHRQDPDAHLALFRQLRATTYEVIRHLPPSAWVNTVVHSENGVMTMDDWLQVYADHPHAHIRQMREVAERWKQQLTNHQ